MIDNKLATWKKIEADCDEMDFSIWEKSYGRKLGRHAKIDILFNLSQFIRTLAEEKARQEWENGNSKEAEKFETFIRDLKY